MFIFNLLFSHFLFKLNNSLPVLYYSFKVAFSIRKSNPILSPRPKTLQIFCTCFPFFTIIVYVLCHYHYTYCLIIFVIIYFTLVYCKVYSILYIAKFFHSCLTLQKWWFKNLYLLVFHVLFNQWTALFKTFCKTRSNQFSETYLITAVTFQGNAIYSLFVVSFSSFKSYLCYI